MESVFKRFAAWEPRILRFSQIGIWLGVLPFFLLCWYAHPSADDFLQANDVSKHGHFGYFKYMYLNWTGRYTAMVGWSFLNPVSYGYAKEWYGLVCFLLLLLLLVTLVLVVRTLVRGAGFSTVQLWHIGAGALLLVTYHLPSTAEYFYWLTGGGYNYLLPGVLLLLALAAYAAHLTQVQPKRLNYLIATAVLLFLTVGCNETIAVPVFLTIGCVIAVESWRQRKLVGAGIGLAVGIGCALTFLAPGNMARVAVEQAVSPGLVGSAVGVIKYTVYCLIIWLGNGVLLAVTVLLVPVFSRLARIPSLPVNRLVGYPVLLSLLVPCFLAAGLFPSVWVSGSLAPSRALNLLYLCFIGSWMLAAYAWTYYFMKNRPGTAPILLPSLVRWALLAWLPFTLLTNYNYHLRNPGQWLNSNNTFAAYRDLLDGSAARYDAQLVSRYQFLRNTPLLHTQVKPLLDPPTTLLFDDITSNQGDWSNQAYADFFQKKSVVIQADSASK